MSDESVKCLKLEMSEINPEALFADGLDDAIVGYAHRCGTQALVVYDYNRCVDVLMRDNGMSGSEAEEWMGFNVVGAYLGPNTPLFFTSIEDIEG